MQTHEVRSWPEFYEQIRTGKRTHELRHNGNNYQIGDLLRLREFNPTPDTTEHHYTGREQLVVITSITSDEIPCAVSQIGLRAGYCILSIKVIDETT